MLGADVLVAEALRFFRRHIQDALALRAERHFDGSRDALANSDAAFDLFAYRFDRALLAQETVGQGFVLAHQAEQQVLRLDVRAAILAGFVPRKKYNASCFFRIPFEHVSSLLPQGPRPPSAKLCVAISDVNLCVRCSRSSNSNTAQAFCSSRSPVGSSASSTDGPVTSARAIATRCCSPPESSPAR